MMYDSKFLAVIKVNSKVLREFKDTVYIPFGSEYQISIKNLHVKRAIAHITIDGTEAVPGGLIINANQTIDLERFVKDLNKGNRFKFIERTESIEQHRGVKMEDGLIRIEFQYEIDYPKFEFPKKWEEPGYNPWGGGYYPPGYPSWGQTGDGRWLNSQPTSVSGSTDSGIQTKGILRGAVATSACCDQLSAQAMNISTASVGKAQSFMNDAGITVPGSESSQKFSSVLGFPVEVEKHVIVLKLLGETPENKPVQTPVTVKHKPTCITCGRTNKANAKFCTNCGTALNIV